MGGEVLGRVCVVRGGALAAVATMVTMVRGRLLLMAATEEVPVEGVIVAAFAQPYRKPIEHAGKPYQVSDHFSVAMLPGAGLPRCVHLTMLGWGRVGGLQCSLVL